LRIQPDLPGLHPTFPEESVIRYLLIGSSFALAAALQPGPLQVFYLSKVSEQGWRKTLPAAFAPLISDGPIALTAVLVIGQLPTGLRVGLQAAGGILLISLAGGSLRRWHQNPDAAPEQTDQAPRTIFQAALVNLLNPNPYLAWSLVLGPAVLEAWSEGSIYALALLLAFYGVMIGTSLVLIRLMGTASALGPASRRRLLLISGLLLAGLGLYYLGTAGWELAVRLA
jgi:threonine/homoserine/homoserine lactone efflux protein